MPDLFFSSDTHYFHKNIIRLCNRPYSSLEEMNEALISNWNFVVKPQDQVWHLGDFSFGDYNETKSVLQRLNGHKHFVRGNHDQIFKKHKDLYSFFESVQDYKELKWNNQRLVISHYPFLSWNGGHRGSWHLCGHSHNSLNHWHKQTTSLDVGVDVFNYTPISFEDIKKEFATKIYKSIDHHIIDR